MKLPFVSREAYDQLKAVYEKECREKQHLHERYALLQTLVMERGLQPLPPAETPVPPVVQKEDSRVAKRIREESGGDPRLAQHFAKLAQRLRAEGKTEGDILAQIGWHEDSL